MIRRAGVTVAMVLSLGLAAPVAAHASGSSAAAHDCIVHSVTATQVGPKLEVDTTLTNACGRRLSGSVAYRLTGTCGHVHTVPVVLYEGSEDVVTFFKAPCAGHYTLTQRVSASGSREGTDTIEFDVTA